MGAPGLERGSRVHSLWRCADSCSWASLRNAIRAGSSRAVRTTARSASFAFWELPVAELPVTWADAKHRLAEPQAADSRP